MQQLPTTPINKRTANMFRPPNADIIPTSHQHHHQPGKINVHLLLWRKSLFKTTALPMAKSEVIIRVPKTHKSAFFRLDAMTWYVRQVRRIGVMRIPH